MYKYAQIEAAIAEVHGVPASAMKTFRSRVRNFQRIGLVPSSPGKGQKIAYTTEDAIFWALCFELVEVGLTPAWIKTVTQQSAYSLIGFFEGPVPTAGEYLVLGGDFLGWHLNEGKGARFSIGVVPAAKLQKEVLGRADLPRVILINMTSLKRKLGLALGIDWSKYERNWDPEASPAKPQEGDRAG